MKPPTLFHSLAFFLLFISSTLITTTTTTCSQGQLLPIPIKPTTNASSHHETYIVHVQHSNGSNKLLSSEEQNKWYKSFLPSKAIDSGEPRLVYSYHHTITGFAARLTRQELKAMELMHGFIHASPDRLLALHTTHTADFLGLNQGSCFQRDSSLGKGMIIGVLDTGISPSHPSFRDEGLPHPPAKWKGHCDFKPGECNSKLIGAKSFKQGRKDLPADGDGHGSHAAGVAAGSPVGNAEVLGNARGTAAGIAPAAHLAMYKVCHPECRASDVLAGIDQAVADGVDVISVSFGGKKSVPLYDDVVAIGSLAAVEKGVFVSCSAGNGGPASGTVENDAPWVLTVGASTMDRSMRATVRLGNGGEFGGESAYHPSGFTSAMLPVVYPGARGGSRAKACSDGSLNHVNIRGKIVVCRNTPGSNSTVEKGAVVMNAGGVGMILVNEPEHMSTVHAAAHVLPTSHVSHADGLAILSYIESSSNPTATIFFDGTLYGISPAPSVAAFSSRGPSRVNEGVLKPDVVGPGVNILAAWPFPVGPHTSRQPAHNSTQAFNILSGTSMSAPLLAGVATLLKVSHPGWSPEAIKSAIMTSADTIDRDGALITGETSSNTSYFATGAGHVNPSKANDPGLIYDITAANYVAYLCGLEYTDKQVSAVTRRATQCSTVDVMSAEELNYPSISVSMGPSGEKTISRTVTNVGETDSVYTVQVRAPEGVAVTVYPDKLRFSKTQQNASYNVYLSTGDTRAMRGSMSQGQLRWVSSKHIVRSPISITFT